MGNAGVVSTTRGLADVLSPRLSEYASLLSHVLATWDRPDKAISTQT